MRKVVCFNSQRDGILHIRLILCRVLIAFQFPTGWNSTLRYGIPHSARNRFNSQRDGILLDTSCKSRKAYIVSIPNGMEFYFGGLPIIAIYTVSIPNGMEFYSDSLRACVCIAAFQFPTGWNSTEIDPNSFYFYTAFQFPTGWNSTFTRTCFMPRKIVSIPNGMEFYACIYPRLIVGLSFQFPTGWNSTGNVMLAFLEFASFQFPTGWNSTIRFRRFRQLLLVSIPNGMEFYFPSLSPIWAKSSGFNSQRDGILLAEFTFGFPIIYVSIPNGMEFYCFCSSSLAPDLRFQFPTGWNSTAANRHT